MVRCGKPTGYLRYGGVPRPREGNTVGNVNKVGCVFISSSPILFLYFSVSLLERKNAILHPPDTSVMEAYHVPVRVTWCDAGTLWIPLLRRRTTSP